MRKTDKERKRKKYKDRQIKKQNDRELKRNQKEREGSTRTGGQISTKADR